MSKKTVEHFQKMANAHAGLANDCGKLEEVFGAMGKAASREDASTYQKAASHFGSMAQSHADASDACNECVKAATDDLEKLVPDAFTSVFPSDVPAVSKVRMVPRGGQPGAEDLAKVPEQFRHLIVTNED
jgi:hypothetical protein